MSQRKWWDVLDVHYLWYAVGRFGITDGLRRWWEFDLWPTLCGRPVRQAWRRWRHRERRPRLRGYGDFKTAIDRDGDLYLVECPVCGDQSVYWHRDRHVFACSGGSGHYFKCYTEDGVRRLVDHRAGRITIFPTVGVYDEAAKVWRLGLTRDAPWWWKRRDVFRDLHDGKDAHGHHRYEVVENEQARQDEAEARACGSEQERV